MPSVQITLDDELVQAIDNTAKKLHMTRSVFARKALWEATQKNFLNTILEKKHRQGYERHPVEKDEFL